MEGFDFNSNLTLPESRQSDILEYNFCLIGNFPISLKAAIYIKGGNYEFYYLLD